MAKVIGAKEHTKNLRRLAGPEMARKVGAALFAGGQAIQVEAQRSITAGAVSGKNHVPSRPGEPPNQDTGVLANNIETVQITPLRVEVSSNAPYSAALEYGSKREAGVTSRSFAGHSAQYGPSKAKHGPVRIEYGDSQTEARPFMAPAAAAKRKEVTRLVREAVAKTIKGA